MSTPPTARDAMTTYINDGIAASLMQYVPPKMNRATIAEACAVMTAVLWKRHPHAESIVVKWNARSQTFTTRVRYPPVVSCSITITL